MSGFFCEKHQVDFFKTPKMKGYAHPVEGGGGWCNMADDLPPAVEVETHHKKALPEKMTKTDWTDKDTITRESIQKQTALKSATDLFVARIGAGHTDIKASTVLSWAEVFKNWLVDNTPKEE